MSANGISHETLKRDRQDRKLEIAEASRQGKTVADDGTISGSVDPTATSYRTANTLDASLLPSRYNASSNTGTPVTTTPPLVDGRPWT